MEGFLHIYKKNENYNEIYNIPQMIKEYKSNSLFVYQKKDKKISSYYYTNEHVEYPYNDDFYGLFTPTGIFTRNIIDIKEKLIKSKPQYNLDYISNLEGQFAIAYSDFNNQELNLFTHVARIENIYSAESDDFIIVGTDPLIVNLIMSKGKIEFDVESMYSFILNGYYADNQTPFKKVTALPGNSFIKVNENGLNIINIDDFYSNLFSKEYEKKDYDNLTDIFINGFNTQDNKNKFKLALTGGKDSRLIFAAMNSNHFNLTTYTNGFRDNPDVIIAEKIADIYNIEHEVISPKVSKENTITLNIYKKIKNVMMSTSGMVYGYENVSLLGPFKGHRSFDGVGAELIKGGFSMFVNSSQNSDKNKLVNAFNKNHQHLKNQENNPFGKFLTEFIDSDHGLPELQILYSLLYRTGRLTAAAKNASNYTTKTHSPFLDNKFLKESLKINYLDNKNEEIHYQIMRRIDKRIVDIPFAKDRWRIENDKPLFKSDYQNWLKRQPLYPDTVLGNYNWRQIQNNDKVIVNQFRQIILDDPNHIIFEIVNYNDVKIIFSKNIKAIHMRFLWSLASIIIFVNELNKVSNQSFNNNIKLKLPSTSISSFKNKKSIVDVTNKFYPLNSSIQIQDKSHEIKLINMEKHRKLKLFDGKFSEAPKEIVINNISKLNVRINIEQKVDHEVIKAQILFFKNNKRIKTYSMENDFDDKNNNFHYIDHEVNNYDSFRILINFNDSDIDNKFMLNYAYYEITE